LTHPQEQTACEIDGVGATGRDYRRRLLLIALTAFVVCVIHFLNFALQPPLEGDAYEFAEIAQHLVKDHAWQETHLRGVGVVSDKLPLPHAPGRRGALYAFFLVPFYAVFHERWATVVAPYLLCCFLLPLVAYRFGRRYFRDRAAFLAALALAFQPMFFEFYVRDPVLDSLLLILIILTLDFFLRRRFLVAGALLGLAVFAKENAVVFYPALFLWAAIFDRRLYRNWRFYLMIAISFGVILPVLYVRAQSYDDPIHCEDGLFMAGANLNYRDESVSKFQHSLSLPQSVRADRPRTPLAERLARRAFVAVRNVKFFAVGNVMEYAAFPGAPESFSLFLFPFFFYGVFLRRRDPPSVLLAIWVAGFAATMLLFVDHYEDRYYFPIFPLGYLFAFDGLLSARFFRGPPGKRRLAVLLSLIMAFEVLPTYFTVTLGNVVRTIAEGNPYSEMRAMGAYVQKTTEPTSVFATQPFFSTSFYLGRLTTFFPYGSYDEINIFQKKYNHSFAFVPRRRPMGLRSLFRPIVLGKYYSLYKLQEKQFGALAASFPELMNVNPLAVGFVPAIGDNLFLQFPRVMKLVVGNWWLTAGAYLACVGLALAFLLSRSWRGRWLGGLRRRTGVLFLAVVVAVLGLGVAYMNSQMESREISLDEKIEALEGLDGNRSRRLKIDLFGREESAIAKALDAVEEKGAAAGGAVKPLLLIIPIPEIARNILTIEDVADAAEATMETNRQVDVLCARLQERGYRVLAIDEKILAYQRVIGGGAEATD
jgi:hypothetical protein